MEKENFFNLQISKEVEDSKETQDQEKKEDVKEEVVSDDLTKKEIDDLKKQLRDTHKWGNSSAKKIKNVIKTVQKMIEDGVLTEDEGSSVLSVAKLEDSDLEIADENPYKKVLGAISSELQNMKKYTNDKDFDEKVEAFDYLLSVSNKKEVEEIFEELGDFGDDIIGMTKRVMEIGEEALEDQYRELKKNGGYKQHVSAKNTENKKLKMEIEKLKKQIEAIKPYVEQSAFINDSGNTTKSIDNDKKFSLKDLTGR